LHHGHFFFAKIGITKFRTHFLGLDLVDAGVDGDAGDPMFERHFAGELRELLKNLGENHLAKILFVGAPGAMGAHEFKDERMEPADQLAGGVFIVLERSGDERTGIRLISDLVQGVLTLTDDRGARVGVTKSPARIDLASKDQSEGGCAFRHCREKNL
jgi:hypothetical protein